MNVLAELGAVKLPHGAVEPETGFGAGAMASAGDGPLGGNGEPRVGRFARGAQVPVDGQEQDVRKSLRGAIESGSSDGNGAATTMRTDREGDGVSKSGARPHNIPMLIVFNKMDACRDPQEISLLKIWASRLMREYGTDAPLFVSARNPGDVELVRAAVMRFFDRSMQTYELLVPFEDGKTIAQIHEVGNIQSKHETEKGLFFRIRTMPEFARQLNLERYRI
jgi:hypothetical protein